VAEPTQQTEQVNPRSLHPNTVVRHRSGGIVTLARRKEDDSGWWNTDGSGLADSIWKNGSWTVVTDWDPFTAPLTEVFATAILRAGGRRIDADGWSKVCAAVMERTMAGTYRPKPFKDWPGCAP
jgi:hypothetical protein